ncbi:Rieske (2Fe-2S) protein [Chelativorans xinjiangense]|uniref:Rieske (2Fe-2S) protein n=1 Tax=Chelativorans xinjiangense TaxID=2681485 RepID=UPI0013575653|nr:Rieske (2Fe-2S) protein [Chelativorans xinjiangense]
MEERNDWHPVALSTSIKPATSAGTRLFDEELVVWRDTGEATHIWEDRCPHRGMKLSFGFVRGDHIACLYHGWQYDAAGQCRYIPAHPDIKVPPAIKVKTYGAAEQDGMIWAALGPDLPPLPSRSATETLPVRSLYLRGGTGRALNLLRDHPPRSFTQEAGPAQIEPVSPTLFRIRAGTDALLIGVQALSGSRTALHIVIAGPAAAYQGAGQLHFLRWANALRHDAETVQVEPAATALGEAV